MPAYLAAWRRFGDFAGRTSRRDFWTYFLINLVAYVMALVIARTLALLYALAVFIPNLGMHIRRLHDVGRSGWWLLLALIPLVGDILLLVWLALPGEPGPNRWGPPPAPTL